MSIVRHAALVIWELPQNVLGALLLGVTKTIGAAQEVSIEQGRVFVRANGIGISLGHFVFYTDRSTRWYRADPLMKRHEHGHTFQSRWFGPLYLPVIGVPSVMRATYAVAYREVTGQKWRGYYDGYPEKWADRLGGISAEERAAQLARDDGSAERNAARPSPPR